MGEHALVLARARVCTSVSGGRVGAAGGRGWGALSSGGSVCECVVVSMSVSVRVCVRFDAKAGNRANPMRTTSFCRQVGFIFKDSGHATLCS